MGKGLHRVGKIKNIAYVMVMHCTLFLLFVFRQVKKILYHLDILKSIEIEIINFPLTCENI